jgi:23S rRNA maturation mini-RNase III
LYLTEQKERLNELFDLIIKIVEEGLLWVII